MAAMRALRPKVTAARLRPGEPLTFSAPVEDIHAFDADSPLLANGLNCAGLNADAKSLRQRPAADSPTRVLSTAFFHS